MRLRNISNGPVYESITASEITTGKTTTDINILKEALHKILHDTRFEPILNDDELKQLSILKERAEIAKNRKVEDLPGYDDPYGLKAIEKKRHEKELALQNARIAIIEAERKRKEMFKDRNIEETVEDLVPKKLDGKPQSLKDIMQHNAAVKKGQ